MPCSMRHFTIASLHALEARAGDRLDGSLDLEPYEPGGECSSLEAGALRELVDRLGRGPQGGEERVARGEGGPGRSRAGRSRQAELQEDVVRALHELRSLLDQPVATLRKRRVDRAGNGEHVS